MISSTRVRLTFPEDLITEPILGRMVRTFDVLPNIRRANVTEDTGWIVCELDGDLAVIESAVAWLIEQGVRVDYIDEPLES